MIGLIAAVVLAQVQPGETRGAVFAVDDGRPGAKMFDIVRRVSRTPVGWAATMEFRAPSGALAVKERVEFGLNIQPTSYRRRQFQTGGRGTVRVQDGMIEYQWQDAAGRTYRDTESVDDNVLMIGPMMFAFFMRHWSRIDRGETLKFNIIVPDRQTSYSFEFQKVGVVIAEDGVRLAKCELRLTGLLGLFVGDMVFYLDPDTGDLVRYTGIVLPKVRKGDDWTNLKGMVRYELPSNHDIVRKPGGLREAPNAE